jgi:putative peptide zinc metalloprotease protein
MGAMIAAASAIEIRPQLKANVDVFRHVIRNEVWYLFHDRALDRQYWLAAGGAEIVGALDGKRSIEEIRREFAVRRGADAIESDDLARFFNQLHSLGLLRSGVAPAAAEIDRKRSLGGRRKVVGLLKSPLMLRIPLLDPAPILDRLQRFTPFLFSRAGVALWFAVVLVGAVIGIMHWGELTHDLTDRMLSVENLAVAWLVYPAIKIVHEFMHALVLRHFGGEVRRMGIIMIAFVPVPYVDASASAAFPDKHRRVLVAAAGMMAELFLCGLAVMGWVLAEPSLFRVVCYNVILITGISTLLFNGNPLQRYDGYYILTDLVEIPGLAMRSMQMTTYLARRWLLADPDAKPPRAAPGETIWFYLYGPASFVYRTLLMLSIGLYVYHTYKAVGTVLVLWTFGAMLWGPGKAIVQLIKSETPGRRSRAFLRLGVIGAVAATLLFVVPVPFGAVVVGTVWVPEEANARSRAAGEVAAVLVSPRQHVAAGDPIVNLANPDVDRRVLVAQARLREMEASYTQASAVNRVQAAILADKVEQARDELNQALADRAGLVVRSPAAGEVIFPDQVALAGRYYAKGEAIAMIWDARDTIVRAIVPQWEIDLVRARTRSVSVKPAYDPQATLPAEILRMVPSATDQLSSSVLSIEGGGPFAVTRDRDNAVRMSEAMFQVDVRILRALPVDFLNGLANVRFDLGWEPIGFQLYRKVRLAFLRHFNA